MGVDHYISAHFEQRSLVLPNTLGSSKKKAWTLFTYAFKMKVKVLPKYVKKRVLYMHSHHFLMDTHHCVCLFLVSWTAFKIP